MSKHVDTSYWCDFCGHVCNTRRVHIPGHPFAPVHLCVVTNDLDNKKVTYMLDICENCAKKLSRVPLETKHKEEDANERT